MYFLLMCINCLNSIYDIEFHHANKWLQLIKDSNYMFNSKASPYVKFLNLINALDRVNPGKRLDNIEESLLDRVILSANEGQSILVGGLISIADLGSQTTLHGRLKNLSAMGYIKLAANSDGRKKEVLPTKMALKRYEELSKCLEKAAKTV